MQNYWNINIENNEMKMLLDMEANDIKVLCNQIGVGLLQHWNGNEKRWENKSKQTAFNPRAIYRTNIERLKTTPSMWHIKNI